MSSMAVRSSPDLRSSSTCHHGPASTGCASYTPGLATPRLKHTLAREPRALTGGAQMLMPLSAKRPAAVCRAVSLSSPPITVGSYASKAIAAEDAQGPTVLLRIKAPYETAFGQQLVVVGSCAEMGAWKVDAGLPMTWSEGHVWTVDVQLPLELAQGQEFKVIVTNSDPTCAPIWEPGANRKIQMQVKEASPQQKAETPTLVLWCEWGDEHSHDAQPLVVAVRMSAKAKALAKLQGVKKRLAASMADAAHKPPVAAAALAPPPPGVAPAPPPPSSTKTFSQASSWDIPADWPVIEIPVVEPPQHLHQEWEAQPAARQAQAGREEAKHGSVTDKHRSAPINWREAVGEQGSKHRPAAGAVKTYTVAHAPPPPTLQEQLHHQHHQQHDDDKAPASVLSASASSGDPTALDEHLNGVQEQLSLVTSQVMLLMEQQQLQAEEVVAVAEQQRMLQAQLSLARLAAQTVAQEHQSRSQAGGFFGAGHGDSLAAATDRERELEAQLKGWQAEHDALAEDLRRARNMIAELEEQMSMLEQPHHQRSRVPVMSNWQ